MLVEKVGRRGCDAVKVSNADCGGIELARVGVLVDEEPATGLVAVLGVGVVSVVLRLDSPPKGGVDHPEGCVAGAEAGGGGIGGSDE
jgi:hypothetical protein